MCTIGVYACSSVMQEAGSMGEAKQQEAAGYMMTLSTFIHSLIRSFVFIYLSSFYFCPNQSFCVRVFVIDFTTPSMKNARE